MSPVDDSDVEIANHLLEIVKEISALPECKNTSRYMWSNLVRRIKLLSPLFEELLDREEPQLVDGEIRALKSLWVALNSAKELLLWVNEASKLYQAVHSDQISAKFLKVADQIEQALSGIDYDKLKLSEEVEEQTELVHAQFRRAKYRKDSTCDRLEEDLQVVENEDDPDIVVLKRLLENLHIRTTEDLRKESRAFHELVISSNGEVGDSFEMMSTIFKKLSDYLLTVNSEVDLPDSDNSLSKHRSPVIPDDFRCPISLELMRDPVIVSTGQTYERACIQKWLDAGHKACPKTQQTLSNTDLVPNYVLKSLITLWCENNNVELPKKQQGTCRNTRPGSSGSDCDQSAINSLLGKLIHGSIEDQRAAAGELRLLAKRNADNRVCIADAGAIPPLVELLSSTDERVQEHAVTALLNLSINEANKGIIVNAGAIPDIVEVLKNGSMEGRENAAATLFSLSVMDKNKVAIGAAGAIPALIKLLCEGTPRGKKDAATAIFNLSIYQGNKVRAVRAGVVPPLMGFLKDAGGGMMDEALTILAVLSNHPEGKAAIAEAEPISTLVEVIRSGSPRNRENAAAVLWSLCVGDRQQLLIAIETEAEKVLKELSENGTDRAKRKALSLLELMQRLQNEAQPLNPVE
ncbi:hypothetical protein V2J09_001394 [Rumex salicifolius]